MEKNKNKQLTFSFCSGARHQGRSCSHAEVQRFIGEKSKRRKGQKHRDSAKKTNKNSWWVMFEASVILFMLLSAERKQKALHWKQCQLTLCREDYKNSMTESFVVDRKIPLNIHFMRIKTKLWLLRVHLRQLLLKSRTSHLPDFQVNWLLTFTSRFKLLQ